MTRNRGPAAEVRVIGGGPAGLSAALAIARTGTAVTVFDRATPPIDKACGEGLMPDSLNALRELGVSVPPGVGFPFRGIRFVDGEITVGADFPNGHALGIRRTELHNFLVAAAESAGVSLRWGIRAAPCSEPSFLVAADGQNSSLRRYAGLDDAIKNSYRYGFRRHYRIAPWSEYMELYWTGAGQLYVTPVARDEVCIAVLSSRPSFRVASALQLVPRLAARLRDACPTTSERGGLSVSRTLRHVQRPGLALIGDSSGSVDAITGEGLGLAFHQAIALAEALQRDDLTIYEAKHRAVRRRAAQMSWLLLQLSSNHGLRRKVMAALAKRPEVFASFLGIHVGERSFFNLLPADALRLGVAMLRPAKQSGGA